jgi:hypothetical protein
VGPGEPLPDVGEDRAGAAGFKPDHEPAGRSGGERGGGGLGPVGGVDDALGLGQEGAPGVGEVHPAAVAGEQSQVQGAFEGLDQGIAGSAGQQWWWNPLRGVTTIAPARLLAGYFVDASTTAGSVGNDYFGGGSQELLALHLLAAASAGGDLLHTLEWLSDDNTPVPAQILDAHHHPVPAMAMRRARGINPRQRDGLFDMARRYLSVLGEPSYALSVTPPLRCPSTPTVSSAPKSLCTTYLSSTRPRSSPATTPCSPCPRKGGRRARR